MNEECKPYYRDKRVLITGGLGFIGSSLALQLVEFGAKVTIIDGRIPDLGANFFNIEPIRNKVEVVIANLSDRSATDYHVVDKDIVFNIGMHSSHLDSMSNPIFDLDTNIVPQLHFLESIRNHNPTVRIVYIGSRAQYGKVSTFPITEETPLFPADIYAAGKQVVEWYHFLFSNICGLKATSLRLGNTYGPRHQMKHAKYGVQNFLLRLALDGEELKVFGDGQQLREMIYISDVVQALLLIGMKEETMGEMYCIGTHERVTFLELVQHIITACSKGSYRHCEWPRDREIIEVGDIRTDFSKLTRDTGWQPRVKLQDGLVRTADYYKKYREHYW